MGALSNLSKYMAKVPAAKFIDPVGFQTNAFVGREAAPGPGPQAVPMPDPQALALEQRRMFARMASAGQGRAATILSQQPAGERLGS